MQQGILKLSSNRGRYEVCATGSVAFDTEASPDLTAGMVIEICIGGQWIRGSVEHGPVYATSLTGGGYKKGYYFIATDGSIVGLCEGMKVRVP
jgi:Domain of unknown function (DUF5348)